MRYLLLIFMFISCDSLANKWQVLDTMQVCVTPKERLHLATSVGEAGDKYFRDPEVRQWWYILLCMESNFNPKAGPSSAGAVGIGQVMPQFAEEFARNCDVDPPVVDKLKDLDVGLALSACRFRDLIVKYDGHPMLSLAAYNAGPSSKAVKRVLSGEVRPMNKETLGYIAQASLLFENIKRLPSTRNLVDEFEMCHAEPFYERNQSWPYLD